MEQHEQGWSGSYPSQPERRMEDEPADENRPQQTMLRPLKIAAESAMQWADLSSGVNSYGCANGY